MGELNEEPKAVFSIFEKGASTLRPNGKDPTKMIVPDNC